MRARRCQYREFAGLPGMRMKNSAARIPAHGDPCTTRAAVLGARDSQRANSNRQTPGLAPFKQRLRSAALLNFERVLHWQEERTQTYQTSAARQTPVADQPFLHPRVDGFGALSRQLAGVHNRH